MDGWTDGQMRCKEMQMPHNDHEIFSALQGLKTTSKPEDRTGMICYAKVGNRRKEDKSKKRVT